MKAVFATLLAASAASAQILDLPTELMQDVHKGIAPTVNVIADQSSDLEGKEILKSIRLADAYRSHGVSNRAFSFLAKRDAPGAFGSDVGAAGTYGAASGSSAGTGSADSAAGLASTLRSLVNEVSRAGAAAASASVNVGPSRANTAAGSAGNISNMLGAGSAGSAAESNVRNTLSSAAMTFDRAASVNESAQQREIEDSIRAAMKSPSRMGSYPEMTEGETSAGAQ